MPEATLQRDIPHERTSIKAAPGSDSFRWPWIAGLTLLILATYSYPALRATWKTGITALPPVTAEDLGLYLSLSQLEKNSEGSLIDPYYHLSAPANSAGFLKFRLIPILFGVLTKIFGGRLWLSLFVWNLVWWSFLCLITAWLFKTCLPRAPTELVLAGICLLMLTTLGNSKAMLSAWTRLPSLVPFQRIEMAYIRPFTPQVAIPLLLLYLGWQMLALSGRRVWPWIAMAFLQFLAFASFPYATLAMAGITAVVAVQQIFSRSKLLSWRHLVIYGVACAALDFMFLHQGQGGFRTGTPGQGSLIHVDLTLLRFMVGRLWVVMLILLTALIATKRLRLEVKWPLIGLCSVTMLLVLGDAVIPERVLFLSEHAGYFVQPTIVIVAVFLLSSLWPARRSRGVMAICGAVIMLCLVNGMLLAEANYRQHLGRNLDQADVVHWAQANQVGSNDLVIAPHEICTWVPLVSPARVLFCPIAQCVLSPAQNQQVQRFREVLYLYFTGKDRNWLETATTHFEQYGFYYETSAKGEDPSAAIAKSRTEMRPYFKLVEAQDPSVRELFRGYRNVWILQPSQASSTFRDESLSTYLTLQRTETIGGLRVTLASAK